VGVSWIADCWFLVYYNSIESEMGLVIVYNFIQGFLSLGAIEIIDNQNRCKSKFKTIYNIAQLSLLG